MAKPTTKDGTLYRFEARLTPDEIKNLETLVVITGEKRNKLTEANIALLTAATLSDDDG